MNILGLDIGSSSVKAGILRKGRVAGRISRIEFPTRYDGVRAEVDADSILRALAGACRQLPSNHIDLLALSVMSPSWVAMDKRGRAITPVVTHQDRRSVEVAKDLEKRVGKQRHLRLAGNRPFPGGISSTTCAWFLQHERALMRRADLVGHLNTFLHRRLTRSRLTDPSNASFMGLYRTLTLGGWSDELRDAIGISMHALPQILWADEIGGMLAHEGGRLLGIRHGTPMLVGLTDAGAAMLHAGARPGQLLNLSGSTDVLVLCTDRPSPHERLLTRALGVGNRWLSVSTLAAAGSTLSWLHEQMFRDLPRRRFDELLRRRRRSQLSQGGVHFEPYLAGDRTSLEQRTAAFTGLTLATTRDDLLDAAVDALARASAERLDLLTSVNPIPIQRRVLVSGGVNQGLSSILRRDWKGKWIFQIEDEATLRGLWTLACA